MKFVILKILKIFFVHKILNYYKYIFYKFKGFLGFLKLYLFIKEVGKNCISDLSTTLKNPKNISIGNNVVLGSNVVLGAHNKIILKDNVRLSYNVTLETGTLDIKNEKIPTTHLSKSITLNEGVWIGCGSTVLGGVNIGKNTIVGAGSIVTKDFPENLVIAGNPAKVINKLKK